MHKKYFSNLSAKVKNDVAEIACYLTTPVFKSRQNDDASFSIRIFRREETDFTFNDDYEEYFDGLSYENAEILFEGTVNLINNRKIVFHDNTVRWRKTYSYWIAPEDGGAPTGPIYVRVRDPQIWWSQSEITQRLERLTEKYPAKVLLQEFGSTIRGNAIKGIIAGNRQRMIALMGAIHPGESGPELIIPALERLLEENSQLLEKTGVAILPSICIDQREEMVQGNPWYLRKNYNDVDLNRNFPAGWDEVACTYGLNTSDPDAKTYRGSAPCSEPETRAVIHFIESVKPSCVLSFHCLAGICGPCFLTSKTAVDDADFAEECKQFIAPYTQGFYGEERELKLKFACDAGSFTRWLYDEHRIPGFDLEWDGEEKSKISHSDNTTRELMTEYQERHYRGLVRMLRELAI